MSYVCSNCKKEFPGNPWNGEDWGISWCSRKCQIEFDKERERQYREKKGDQ